MFTRLALAALFLCLWPSAARSAPETIQFRAGEIMIGREAGPTRGWRPVRLPNVDFVSQDEKRAWLRSGTRIGDAWLRLRFDRDTVGGGPLALAITRTPERVTVMLNGRQVFSTIPADGCEAFAWNRPEFVPLPPDLLRPGRNELILQLRSSVPLGIGAGPIRIGPEAPVRGFYQRQYAAQFLGPIAITFALIVLALAALGVWVVRPQEREFGLLALVGVLWAFRNLHAFVAFVPGFNTLFWGLVVDSLYALTVALFAFAVEFLKVPGRGRIVFWMIAVLLPAAILRYVLAANVIPDTVAIAVLFPAVLFPAPFLFRAWRTTRSSEHLALLVAILATAILSTIDFVTVKFPFAGPGFRLQPYCAVIVLWAFEYALGRRILGAFDTVANLNTVLMQRVDEARTRLEESEKARRDLEVANAVEQERTRLMGEIHDGIGASLVTAIASAKQQPGAAEAVDVLRRSLADLKIAVDSLEPIEGDVALLLASFRHRFERDLNRSGVVLTWKVDEVPPLPWLDAVGALQVLRILQESVGNVLTHAGASQIEVTCAECARGEKGGVLIGIADNGTGFDPGTPRTGGKGLANMQRRAESIGARFECTAAQGRGTQVSLWLPLERRAGNRT